MQMEVVLLHKNDDGCLIPLADYLGSSFEHANHVRFNVVCWLKKGRDVNNVWVTPFQRWVNIILPAGL